MVTHAQYLIFFARALRSMARIVEELGDETANRKLPVPGSNTPYAVLDHCLGAIGYWAGEVVAGRPAHRDRDAEFTAKGDVKQLIERVRATSVQLAKDIEGVQPRTQLTLPGFEDHGVALFHLYTDVVQHHGQLEITRDVLLGQKEGTK